MGSIILRDVGVTAGHQLFQNLTFTLADGDRLGLVAANGGGKSTLLRCLAGLAEPSQGTITASRGLRVALVEQDLPATLLDLPLADALRRAIPPAERRAKAGASRSSSMGSRRRPSCVPGRSVSSVAAGSGWR